MSGESVNLNVHSDLKTPVKNKESKKKEKEAPGAPRKKNNSKNMVTKEKGDKRIRRKVKRKIL